jgi:hypothetical protein
MLWVHLNQNLRFIVTDHKNHDPRFRETKKRATHPRPLFAQVFILRLLHLRAFAVE